MNQFQIISLELQFYAATHLNHLYRMYGVIHYIHTSIPSLLKANKLFTYIDNENNSHLKLTRYSFNQHLFIRVRLLENAFVNSTESAFVNEDLKTDVGARSGQQSELFRWVCDAILGNCLLKKDLVILIRVRFLGQVVTGS